MKSYTLPVLAILSLTFAVSWTLAERPVRKSVAPPAPPPEATLSRHCCRRRAR